MNKVIMIGNLTRDPESGTTQSEVAYCRFSIAVNRKFSREGDPNADFFNVTAWRGLAENCAKYLQKGKKVCVVGSILTRQYEAEDGSKRMSYDIVADDVEFLSSNNTNANSDKEQSSESDSNSQPISEDDLPF